MNDSTNYLEAELLDLREPKAECVGLHESTAVVVPSAFTFETCPGCAGPVFLRASEDDAGVEEVCEVCGKISDLFVKPPKEDNPAPVKRGKEGLAPMPLGMVFKAEPVSEPCLST